MKNRSILTRDAAHLSKAQQAMLQTAFSPDNFEPFLKKTLAILVGPGGCYPGSKAAVLLKDWNGAGPKAFSAGFGKADLAALLAGGKPAAGAGRFFALPIAAGNGRAGRAALLLKAAPENQFAAKALLGMAAQFIAARLQGEKRDAELNAEKDVAASVKHVEELYLAYPGISIEEISRAVLDEARRLTGSEFGFTSYVDPATGSLLTASMAVEASAKCRMESRPVAFKDLKGLWGWVARRKKPLLTNAAARDRRAAGLPRGHVKVDKFLGAPAMSGRRLLGILALANPAGDYTARDLDAAQKLARVYAIILQRKAAEDRQREEDTRFRTIISSTKDVIYTASLDGRITFASPQVEDYGYSQREVLGRSVVEFAHPEDKDFVIKAFANAVRTGRTLPILPYRVRRRDGTYFYAEQKSGIVFKGSRPAYITGVIRDVTDQKLTELRLKESEALMRMVFDNARDAIFIKDMNGMYVKANKACADLMKTTPEAMIGRSDNDYLGREAAEAIFRSDSEVVRSGRTVSLNNLHPFPAGSRYVNIVKTPLKNAAGETIGILGIARDISELKRMEAELATARAAEAVSKVARPMAHDFNNALAAINGYATLIDDGLARDNPIKNEITQIIKAVGRAAELMNQFQDFARNPRIDGQGGHHA